MPTQVQPSQTRWCDVALLAVFLNLSIGYSVADELDGPTRRRVASTGRQVAYLDSFEKPDHEVTTLYPSLKFIAIDSTEGQELDRHTGQLAAGDFIRTGACTCESCLAGGDSDDEWVGYRNPLQNMTFFLGLDGSKQPQDFGINAQFGGRTAFNWGVPLLESQGLGLQLGTAIDATADAVQVVQRTQGSSGRTQNFTTVGLFQRTESGVRWGFVYDFLYQNYYDTFHLGQWRIDLSYQFSPRNTIGVWSALRSDKSDGTYGATPITLVPINQTNMYFNHTWCNNAQTMFWGGLASSHGQVNGVLGDLPRLENRFTFGSQLSIPLTDHLAIFGQGNFITPASSGTVDSYLGFAFIPGGGLLRSCGKSFLPLQQVGAPTNFAVDLRRR
jgi:hypothetical protein